MGPLSVASSNKTWSLLWISLSAVALLCLSFAQVGRAVGRKPKRILAQAKIDLCVCFIWSCVYEREKEYSVCARSCCPLPTKFGANFRSARATEVVTRTTAATTTTTAATTTGSQSYHSTTHTHNLPRYVRIASTKEIGISEAGIHQKETKFYFCSWNSLATYISISCLLFTVFNTKLHFD